MSPICLYWGLYIVNQEFGLGQTALVISPRALKVLFSLSLLGAFNKLLDPKSFP